MWLLQEERNVEPTYSNKVEHVFDGERHEDGALG
jgi:hypothetical protein